MNTYCIAIHLLAGELRRRQIDTLAFMALSAFAMEPRAVFKKSFPLPRVPRSGSAEGEGVG